MFVSMYQVELLWLQVLVAWWNVVGVLRQRIMGQIKEQIKTPKNEINKMEISNLLHAELKTPVIRMLKELSEDLNSIKNIVRNGGYTN